MSAILIATQICAFRSSEEFRQIFEEDLLGAWKIPVGSVVNVIACAYNMEL